MNKLLYIILGLFGLQACRSETPAPSDAPIPPTTAPSVPTTPGYRLALDSKNPGPAWKKLELNEPAPTSERDVRALAYLRGDPHIVLVQAIHMHWETGSPDLFAETDVRRWKDVYPDAIVSPVERTSDGRAAAFHFTHRRERGPIRIAYYGYVRLPAAKGLIRVTGEADVEDAELTEAAFMTVLASLEVRSL